MDLMAAGVRTGAIVAGSSRLESPRRAAVQLEGVPSSQVMSRMFRSVGCVTCVSEYRRCVTVVNSCREMPHAFVEICVEIGARCGAAGQRIGPEARADALWVRGMGGADEGALTKGEEWT